MTFLSTYSIVRQTRVKSKRWKAKCFQQTHGCCILSYSIATHAKIASALNQIKQHFQATRMQTSYEGGLCSAFRSSEHGDARNCTTAKFCPPDTSLLQTNWLPICPPGTARPQHPSRVPAGWWVDCTAALPCCAVQSTSAVTPSAARAGDGRRSSNNSAALSIRRRAGDTRVWAPAGYRAQH